MPQLSYLAKNIFCFLNFFFNPFTPLSIENFPLAAIEDDKNRLLPIHMPTSMFHHNHSFMFLDRPFFDRSFYIRNELDWPF